MKLDKDFLLSVQRPARYIAQEFNSTKKDPARCKIKIALAFPDIYEIGMSNLGFRIIYDILNRSEDILCERVFCPWLDMEKAMQDNNIKLFSLENKIPIDEFDLIGFSLNHELNYTNILTMLDLAVIPIRAVDRKKNHPLVIAGGMCCLNPEPIKEIFDALHIGEAEDLIIEVAEIFRNNSERDSRLEALSELEGMVVSRYFNEGTKVKKRYIKELSIDYAPKKWIVPFLQIVHDRVGVELMRGCPNSCRFCQSRSNYWPLRIRKKEDVIKIAFDAIENTGYEELSLLSLSTSDHPQVLEIYQELVKLFEGQGVAVALPSIRAKSRLKEILPLWAQNKKSTVTLVPEAGSQRLRDLIDKNLSIDELMDCARTAFENGWRSIKLYFMIGLPTETDEDLKQIVDLIIDLALLGKGFYKKGVRINVSINIFIPKPHTPFQWCRMISKEEFRNKKEIIRQYLNEQRRVNQIKSDIDLKFHNEGSSYLEGILARADKEIFESIYTAWKKGARFDAWSNQMSAEIWEEAFSECNIDADKYLRERNVDENLPWDFINTGISKETLKQEYWAAGLAQVKT